MPPSETSTIKLRPYLVRPFGDEYFRVMRWGGNSKIVTRAMGVQALDRLDEGLSIREVQFRLAEHRGVKPEQVDLEPLLRSLSAADLIAKVDQACIPT